MKLKRGGNGHTLKYRTYVLIYVLLHLFHVTEFSLFIVELKLDNFDNFATGNKVRYRFGKVELCTQQTCDTLSGSEADHQLAMCLHASAERSEATQMLRALLSNVKPNSSSTCEPHKGALMVVSPCQLSRHLYYPEKSHGSAVKAKPSFPSCLQRHALLTLNSWQDVCVTTPWTVDASCSRDKKQ